MTHPSNTTGGWFCMVCNGYHLHGHGCTRYQLQVALPFGWICPKCGGGNAPTTMRCACTPLATLTFGQPSTSPEKAAVSIPQEPQNG